MKLEEPIHGEAEHGGRGEISYSYTGTATHIVEAGESMHDLIREQGMEVGPYTADKSKKNRYLVRRTKPSKKGLHYATPDVRQWRRRDKNAKTKREKIVPPEIVVPAGPNGIVNRVYRRGRAACASGCC